MIIDYTVSGMIGRLLESSLPNKVQTCKELGISYISSVHSSLVTSIDQAALSFTKYSIPNCKIQLYCNATNLRWL